MGDRSYAQVLVSMENLQSKTMYHEGSLNDMALGHRNDTLATALLLQTHIYNIRSLLHI